MHDAETRALRRALLVLVAVAGARWAWSAAPGRPPPPAGSTVRELSVAVSKAASAEERRSRPLAPDERLDPNVATEEDLDRLPGIGPALAAAIVRAREEGIVFTAPEDLTGVRGVGPALLERMRPHLAARFAPAPRTAGRARAEPARAVVDLNSAAPEELQRLPGVGPALAERIVRHRRSSPFASVDDLLAVRGIGPATLEKLRPFARVGRGR